MRVERVREKIIYAIWRAELTRHEISTTGCCLGSTLIQTWNIFLRRGQVDLKPSYQMLHLAQPRPRERVRNMDYIVTLPHHYIYCTVQCGPVIWSPVCPLKIYHKAKEH